MFYWILLWYRHLKKLLQSVYTGMADPSPEVRGAAMFALGQFSDYLQVSEISCFYVLQIIDTATVYQ